MLVYVIALGAAVVVVPLTRGEFRRLGSLRFERIWMLFAGLAIQIGLEFLPLPHARFADVGLALLLGSYLLILGFGISNLGVRGIGVITLGVAMNVLVIALNQGMPTKVPSDVKIETTVKHRPEKPDDVLTVLSDQIVLDSLDASISIGDLVVAAGLVELFYFASRPRRRARGRGGRSQRNTGARTTRLVDLAAAERSEANALGGAAPDDHALERDQHTGIVEGSRD